MEQWFNRFDPKKPARASMTMMSVMNPKNMKDIQELANVVEEWEVKVKNLQLEK